MAFAIVQSVMFFSNETQRYLFFPKLGYNEDKQIYMNRGTYDENEAIR